jgi:endonuclease YncB( thermonuclease family)
MAKQTSKKFSLKKAVLTLGAVAIVAGSATVVKRVIDPGEKVIEVIDGDSFKINGSTAVRLYGADAPELKYCYGNEAKEALSKKIMGKKVILKELRTDIYRRVMALVYLDGELINEYMVKNGFAESHRDAGTQTDVINNAEDFAKENKLGIFSAKCYQLTSPNSKCVIKGNITQYDGTKHYFVPGCNHYTPVTIEKFIGEDWFCTESDAKAAGFIKAPECK